MSIAAGEVSAGSRLWVPSVDEWASMGWYQRKKFVEDRRPVVVQQVVVRCERRHAGPPSDAFEWDQVRKFTADEVAHLTYLRAKRYLASLPEDPDGDLHRAELEDELRRIHGHER